ncbi:energy transducer TonB [Flavobacterium orientale]|uniref:TonB C-terminal domain-containing protein n=1 Tax=Flavobacterium orientale TaxID=1756020 RepID=A0A916XWG1_9FLAO|nr:energy transducer TonB [Flavobacterium orientale]GGD16955.1 hypothetical protein GCM10011343_04720 [Flavobacterium orientale]
MKLVIFALFLSFSGLAQSEVVYTKKLNHTVSGEKVYLESDVDITPKLMYGDNAMNRFLSRNFKYPKENIAVSEIICSFIVEIDGSISDIKVVNEVPEFYSKEALRVLDKFDEPWYPAVKNNVQVRCQYILPIKINRI